MATQDEPIAEPEATSASTTTEALPGGSPVAETSERKDRQTSGSPARSDSPASSVTSPTSTERDAAERQEDSEEADPSNQAAASPANQENPTPSAPPLPNEPLPTQATTSTPPLPSEPIPGQPTPPAAPPLPAAPAPAPQPEDDGWEYHWNASTSSYWFYNRYTQVWQETNPRLEPGYGSSTAAHAPAGPTPIAVASGQVISDPTSVAGGYNPAIHGDYDPNAWYAQAARAAEEPPAPVVIPGVVAGEVSDVNGGTAGFFNRHTGAWQQPDQGPERHSDEAKSRRQLNNFFDVDAAANEFDGRSLKAERSGKKPSKAELKAYKEKRRARKEEKRRAWLRD
ncbi:hypothetical protein CONLIGDRAFT_666736 [Coniochaeta ligniaria NRRL 30616]|uniref:WW domain-containing protein n=1 Tax=Coniochaeta ligniaria NRRL 30616 TaxID=1408157 RepID=A0A1J7K011_9PEZI|nr:hypothetical protein CONLIGDRAFT_666736 [Coniochaeta ligniaria NRRL 30616]